MSNVRLRWTNSTPGPKQRPLAETIIEGRVSDTLPWAELNRRPMPESELLLDNVAAGAWQYRAIEVDVDGRLSLPVATTIDVPFDNPSGVTTLTATLE